MSMRAGLTGQTRQVLKFSWLACCFPLLFGTRLGPFGGRELAFFHAPCVSQVANEMGQIATMPLLEKLRGDGSISNFVGFTIDLFVFISVLVSFLTMGASMKNMVDGHADSIPRESRVPARYLMYLLWFGGVIIIAACNPRGFLKSMEGFTSLSLNIETGLFIMIMFVNARKVEATTNVPWSISPTIAKITTVVGLTFYLSAVLVDVFWLTKSTL